VIDVPIATADDLSAARAAMAEAATSLYTDPAWSQRFLDEPVILGVESLGREETLVRITARVRPLEQWRTARELRGRIRLALDAAGIPPRDLDPNRTVPDGPDPDSAASAPTPSPTPS
jgi:small-conductance mechanosensitive channel